MKTTTEPKQIIDAIMLILANTPDFTNCSKEDGLLRALLHRVWSRLGDETSELEYWGRTANIYANEMLETNELPD